MRLEIIRNDGSQEIVESYKKTTIVGRGSKCDIRIIGPGISREHLSIVIKGTKIILMDLGSSNGTFIKDEKVQPNKPIEFTTLFPIRIGESTTISLLPEEGVVKGIAQKIASVQEDEVQELDVDGKEKLDANRPASRIKMEIVEPNQSKGKQAATKILICIFVLIIAAAGIYIFLPEVANDVIAQITNLL